MTEGDSLLAHLLPRYTNRIEDAATDALVYILNKSECARAALNVLVAKTTGASVEHCISFATQVVVSDDRARPDFVGYDGNGEKRVIGESKFWADLGDGQARAYLEQLPSSGPAVLLFVVPDTRIDSLWTDVNRDVGRKPKPSDRVNEGRRRIGLISSSRRRRMIMVGWVDLLANLSQVTTDDPHITSDINQLQGLIRQQEGRVTFVPLKMEDLSPEFPRRMRGLVDLVYEAISRGQNAGWLTVNRGGTPWTYGYGRYFNIPGLEDSLWFGLDYTWEQSLLVLYDQNSGEFTPIHLLTDTDREIVLNNVVSQLKDICDVLKPPAGTRRHRAAKA